MSGVHRKRIPIRWRDMDAYGHVNNAVFLSYLEEARDEMVRRLFEKRDGEFDYVVARVAIDFRRPLRQDDREVVATCRVERVGRSSIRTREILATRRGGVAAEAEAVLVPHDRVTGTSRPLTPGEKAILAPVARRRRSR
ncbi:MAG TPA: thioesterase family protein [Candidatus Binatia bacterium]|nr:thioesterase family protein [Candidatus Binatia bacterium]